MGLPAKLPLTLFDWMHALMGLALVAWLNIGMASQAVDQVPGYARWGLFGAWLSLSILHDGGFARTFVSQVWPLILLMLYIVAATFFGTEDLRPYLYGFGYLLIIYSLFIYYSRVQFRPVQLSFFLYLAVDTVVVGVNTYFALGQNPLVSRFLATSSETRRALLGEGAFFGIGGYGYTYGLGAIVLSLGFLLLNRPRKRLMLTTLLLGSLLLLMKAAFTIAIVLTLLLLLVLALLRLAKALGLRAPTVAALTTAVVLIGLSAPLLRYLSGLSILPPTVSVRIDEIATGLGGSDLGGTDLHGRMSLYAESVTAFIHNIAFGTSANSDGILRPGGHATWLDLLAVFGLLAMLVLVFLVKVYRLTIERVGPDSKPLVNAFWMYFLILGAVNTLLFANLLMTWFLFLPTATALFRSSLGRPAALSGGRFVGEDRMGTRPATVEGRDSPPRGASSDSGPLHLGSGPGPEVHVSDVQGWVSRDESRPTVLAIHHVSVIGGGTRSFLDILEMLKADYRIIVCCPEDPPTLSSWLRSESYDYLTPRLPMPIFNHYNGGSPLFSRTFLGCLARIPRHRGSWTALIRSLQPDLVIVNSAVLAPLGPAIRAAGAKSLCFVRETFPSRSRSPRTRLIYRILDTAFDGVLFLSKHDKDRAALSRATSEVVRDSVNGRRTATPSRHDACESLGVPEDSFNVLYVGGASRIKGLDVALKALTYLAPEGIRLIVAGDMSAVVAPASRNLTLNRLVDRNSTIFARSVRRLLEQGEVAARTIVVGLQADMALCYSVADIVVFPSTSPHQARPVFEAGMYGLPVVVSEFAETVELVSDGVNGMTFPPGDAEALADRILQLYQDRRRTRALGAANRDMAVRYHSFETERERLLGFVKELLRK